MDGCVKCGMLEMVLSLFVYIVSQYLHLVILKLIIIQTKADSRVPATNDVLWNHYVKGATRDIPFMQAHQK